MLAAVLMVAHVEGLMVAAGGAAGTRTLRAAKYLVGATMNDELETVSDRVLADPGTHPWSRSAHQVLAFVGELGEPAAEFAEVRAKLGVARA